MKSTQVQTLGTGCAHLVVTEDTRHCSREELNYLSFTVCVQVARKVIGVKTLAPLL